MPVMEAAEIHYVASARLGTDPARRGRYYRVVRIGKVVRYRWGVRGSLGCTQNWVFDDEADARLMFSDKKSAARRSTLHVDMYACYLPEASGTIDEAEELFLTKWAARSIEEVLVGGPDPRSHWAVFDGLAQERGWDHGATALRDHLLAGPHAIDPTGRRLVARIAPFNFRRPIPPDHLVFYRHGIHQGNVAGFRWTASLLGPAQASDDMSMAEMLIGVIPRHVYQMLEPDRERVLDIARRMAKVCA